MEKLIEEIKNQILETWKTSMILDQENNKEAAMETKAFADGMYFIYKKLIHSKI